jgi:hypothetical protein
MLLFQYKLLTCGYCSNLNIQYIGHCHSCGCSSIGGCCCTVGFFLFGNCCSPGGFRYTSVAAAPVEFAALHGAAFSAEGVLHNCAAAAPLESTALQGAAPWRLPPQLCGCCSSGVRCFTGGCSLDASSTIQWLLLLWSPLLYMGLLRWRRPVYTIVWLLLLWSSLLLRWRRPFGLATASPLEASNMQVWLLLL